jgi:NADH-quinone oxidoreductase subunit M
MLLYGASLIYGFTGTVAFSGIAAAATHGNVGLVFGPLTKPSLASIKDLTLREGLTLFPLVALTILFGVYPKPVLDMSAASVQQLVNNYNAAMTAVKAAALIQ